MPEQKQIVRWEDPPPPARGKGGGGPGVFRSRYDSIAAELRANPGRWAVVDVVDTARERGGGLVTQITGGHLLCFKPAGDFEAVGRWRGAVLTTYARYLGDGVVDDA